jgi:hypothetical protein
MGASERLYHSLGRECGLGGLTGKRSRDAFPTPYHTLIIPKRHVLDYFGLKQPEINAINRLLTDQKAALQKADLTIDGFNRVWERVVKRMRASGGDSLDPRMVRIKFTPLMPDMNSTRVIESAPGKQTFTALACANLPTSDDFVVYGNEESSTYGGRRRRNRSGRPRSDTFASAE